MSVPLPTHPAPPHRSTSTKSVGCLPNRTPPSNAVVSPHLSCRLKSAGLPNVFRFPSYGIDGSRNAKLPRIAAPVTSVASSDSSTRTWMKQGDDELSICRVVNGMWQTSGSSWGRIDGPAAVEAMIQHADSGLTTFDMADIYGPAEAFYGIFINRVRRERGDEYTQGIQGCTKWCPYPAKMTRRVVEGAVDRSRKQMDVKAIDMMQFHWWEYSDKGYLDALKHLTDLKEEGKIKTLGLTNFDTKRLQIVLENGIPIVSNQMAASPPTTDYSLQEGLPVGGGSQRRLVQHSLIDMRPQQRMAELCTITGVKLITYGTLLGGLLSEKYIDQKDPDGILGTPLTTPSQKKYKRMVDAWGGWNLFQELLRECRTVSRKHGVSISAVGLNYILNQPCVGASMVGVRLGLSQHISQSRAAMALEFEEEDRERLESVMKKGKDVLSVFGDCGDEYR